MTSNHIEETASRWWHWNGFWSSGVLGVSLLSSYPHSISIPCWPISAPHPACKAYMHSIHAAHTRTPALLSTVSYKPLPAATANPHGGDEGLDLPQPSHPSLKEDPGLTNEIPALIKENGAKKRTKSGLGAPLEMLSRVAISCTSKKSFRSGAFQCLIPTPQVAQ